MMSFLLCAAVYPRYLLGRARGLGREAELLIAALLSPHAWVKARLAQGMLAVLDRYRREPYFAEVCTEALGRRVFNPKQLSLLFDREGIQQRLSFLPQLSESGRAMTRDIREYFN